MDAVLHSQTSVLVTGVTGLIGGEIMRRLSSRIGQGNIWPLIRPTEGRTISERLVQRLMRSGEDGHCAVNIHPLAGDILQPNWGLDAEDLRNVVRSAELIIHNAADTSFAAHRHPGMTNIESVRQLINLARQCERVPLLVYMSTAANVGKVKGVCISEEDGCKPENKHFNEYTYSKAVSEQLIRESGMPYLILRPTIVLSAGLPDAVFARQILWCAPLARLFEALPLDAAARLDCVDVGYVAEAALRLLELSNRKYNCYHLSAGPGRSITLGRLCQLVDEHYGRRRPLQLIPPSQWKRAERRRFIRTDLQEKMYVLLRHYFPFLNMDVSYNNERLVNELGPNQPQLQSVESYLGELLHLITTKAALAEALLP